MNIIKLSKYVRYELRCNNTVVIFKNGRSWNYELFNQLDKRSVEVTEKYTNINKINPLNFIIDNNNKKFWDYSSIESMKKSIKAMENAVKSTKNLDNTGIDKNLKSNLRLVNHYIDSTLNKNDTIKNGLIKHRYISDCCGFYEIPKELCKYVKQSKNHPMEKIDFSEFILKNSNGIIDTFDKNELTFIDDGNRLDSNGTHYIEVNGEQINYKNLYIKMLNLYNDFDYTYQLHDIKGNMGLAIIINNNVVALLLPLVSYNRDGKVKKETVKKETKKPMDNRVKEEIKKDVLNGLDVKESITHRLACKVRDNNIHGKTFYIPLETETDNYNRFNIVNNELRHNDINVLIDSSRLTYRDYCNIEDIINDFIKINKLDESIKKVKDEIINILMISNNIDKEDNKETFKFRVYLRKQKETQFLFKYHNTTIFTGKEEVKQIYNNLQLYHDYLEHKLSKVN
jgi:hypothetical protein